MHFFLYWGWLCEFETYCLIGEAIIKKVKLLTKADELWYNMGMENIQKLFDPRIIEKVMSLRLMDDDLMTKVFSDDLEATQFILRILMRNDGLKVLESHSQNDLRNIFGRSIKLDILAEDSDHNLINVEIQRADKGASAKRARYHAAMLDSHFLEKGKDFARLKDTYIIFITENDIWKKGLPVYEIEKSIKGIDLPFDDGLNILYVNGEYRGNDSLGDLMHDFSCQNPDDMRYDELAEKVRYYKQETEGVKSMCKAIEDYGKEIASETREEMIIEMIKKGLDLEMIAEIAKLPIESIKKIAEKCTAKA